MTGFDLGGRVALVTGASRGIGRAIALTLGAHGASVAVHAASRAKDAEEVAAAIAQAGARSIVTLGDIADAPVRAALLADVAARLGPIDILVLNASTETRQEWTEIDDATFDRHVEVNLRAPLRILQAVVPGMAERGWGRVVSLGTIQEVKPNPRLMLYAALKAAQTSMIRNLARQLGGRGVTFNNLAPGAIATERNAAALADPAFRARVEAQIPAGRLGVPQDCAGACLLLCSDAGAYINGATLHVDGGWHAA